MLFRSFASALVVVILAATACSTVGDRTVEDLPSATTGRQDSEDSVTTTLEERSSSPTVRTGAEILAGRGIEELAGKRVGLIANRVSVVEDRHLIDLLYEAPDIQLVSAFAPEHGIRGDADAGELLGDEVDPNTGTPILSLYGSTRAPTAEQLTEVDVLLFDLQDVGTRFYTYISTMGLSMQAAAENGVSFWVLDRPNPLGGATSAGFVRTPELEGFVSQYPIPSVHGLTVGELALAIKGEGWLPGLESLDLQVIPIEGWSRDMLWSDTGREWVSPSPGLPTFESVLGYPGTVLFEATSISYGTGTLRPFTTVGAPWADRAAITETLNAKNLPGVRFEAVAYAPRVIEGLAPSPKLQGVSVEGTRYVITDERTFDPLRTGIHVFKAFTDQATERQVTNFLDRPDFLDTLSGSTALRTGLASGATPDEIIESWRAQNETFAELRQPYLLYE